MNKLINFKLLNFLIQNMFHILHLINTYLNLKILLFIKHLQCSRQLKQKKVFIFHWLDINFLKNKDYSYHFEIKKPFSIVYIGFATQSKDIKVTF